MLDDALRKDMIDEGRRGVFAAFTTTVHDRLKAGMAVDDLYEFMLPHMLEYGLLPGALPVAWDCIQPCGSYTEHKFRSDMVKWAYFHCMAETEGTLGLVNPPDVVVQSVQK